MATGTITQVMNNSGSNSNGRYIKMSDGTMIQCEAKSIPKGSTAITFPVAFASIYSLSLSFGAGGCRYPVYAEDLNNYGFNAVRMDDNNGAMWVRYIAIGRWK